MQKNCFSGLPGYVGSADTSGKQAGKVANNATSGSVGQVKVGEIFFFPPPGPFRSILMAGYNISPMGHESYCWGQGVMNSMRWGRVLLSLVTGTHVQ